jgi:hypothetical protein
MDGVPFVRRSPPSLEWSKSVKEEKKSSPQKKKTIFAKIKKHAG